MGHKLLEKLGHLHSKTTNRFQMALLEHDFIIQYKKGSDMPANYLSRLPATTSDLAIAAFDPFQNDLADQQREEEYPKNILQFGRNKQWPAHLSRRDANLHADLLKKMFHDKEGLLWVRLTDYKYPRTALLCQESIKKKPSAKPTTAFSVATMPLLKPTSRSRHHTTGPASTRI